MRTIRRITACLLVLFLAFTMPVFAGENLKTIKQTNEAKFFDGIATDLVNLYQFDITKEEILQRTLTNLINSDPEALDTFLRALFSSLDEYSEFYSPEEYAELMRSIENVGGGIGIQMSKATRYCEIVNVLDGYPAQKAGVMVGDTILKVDGEDMTGKDSDYVSGKVRGEIGTEVTLTLARGGETFDVTIVRGELKQSTVSYAVLADKVGYIKIDSFSSETDKEVGNALSELYKYNVKKLILDLRYNTGGYLESAVAVAQRFVPKGNIATYKVKYGNQSVDYKSTLPSKKYEMVTLVNEYTASAAELLASALQESGASKLVGKQTYGKAVTQTIMGVYGGRMCKVTTGEYLTRKGNRINKVGIKPDYVVENRTATFDCVSRDPMVYAAKYDAGYDGEALRALKQRLDVLGYDVGSFDTPYDEKMQFAVAAFQNDMGIEPTGTLDINTQICLANKANDAELLVDNQAAKAFELLGIEYTGYLMAE
ncbi:MAG: PDZ domain-containing protein [Ruminococcaceae bacterium]|nr:PDZ domain-containing protein [Oscillospiraceae bacterium]